jgi:hypothetical protein
VAKERRRVMSGGADNDVMRLENLSKVKMLTHLKLKGGRSAEE